MPYQLIILGTPPTLSPLSDISYDEDIIDDQPAIATVSTRPTELSVDTLIHDENSLYLILENASIDLRVSYDCMCIFTIYIYYHLGDGF